MFYRRQIPIHFKIAGSALNFIVRYHSRHVAKPDIEHAEWYLLYGRSIKETFMIELHIYHSYHGYTYSG